jgi:hypothetical protein
MKKASVFTMLGMAVMLVFSSCSKEWTCTCTIDDGYGNTITESGIIEGTKSEAEAECDKGDISLFGITLSECELD